jgi:hypothetical protein
MISSLKIEINKKKIEWILGTRFATMYGFDIIVRLRRLGLT